MRKRKAHNTILRQYKYSVSTDLRPLPAEVWDVGQRMQQAWNALIPAYAESKLEKLSAEYDRILAELKERHQRTIDAMTLAEKGQAGVVRHDEEYRVAKLALDAKKRDAWLNWGEQAKTLIAPFGLDYSQGPNVIERFNGCIKAGRTCNIETELKHIQIPFVFPGSASVPVSKLFNNLRRWRIVIEGYNDAMYQDNRQASRLERKTLYLELGLSRDVAIPLRLDMHRPLPSDGLIKRVLLCASKVPLRGWRWRVLFQVEMPISQITARSEKIVSLRICWTRIEDFILVAQWKDDTGKQGLLCLPLETANHQDRRTVRRRPDWKWLSDYRDLADWKKMEFSLPKGSLERMKMRASRRSVEERWQAKRRWLYRNFAAWLVREYSMIKVPDLDVKSIAEDNTKIGALAGGDHWRQIAAPGDLLAIVKETIQKHGRRSEKYSQTSTSFQSLLIDGLSLRTLREEFGLQLFDVQWNSKECSADCVHAG